MTEPNQSSNLPSGDIDATDSTADYDPDGTCRTLVIVYACRWSPALSTTRSPTRAFHSWKKYPRPRSSVSTWPAITVDPLGSPT
ncbi:MAG TPA: hypothetical protein VE476_05805 [Propionibacteriaceae bacterium]|nr:hypothetical protein [Propionibacteriaceae bacterium]